MFAKGTWLQIVPGIVVPNKKDLQCIYYELKDTKKLEFLCLCSVSRDNFVCIAYAT